MIDSELKKLMGRDGNTKRLRTLKQAHAVINAGWACKRKTHWMLSELTAFRKTTPSETKLLNKALKQIQK